MKSLLWIVLVVAACGKSSDGKAGSNAPGASGPPAGAPVEAAAAGPQDRCEVHVTGAQTVDIVGSRPRGKQDGKLSVGSEYWMTEDEIHDALAVMVRIGGNKLSKDEVERKVEIDMKKDPRLWLLLMNCATDAGFLNLGASNSSRSSDIAFGPHSYAIAGEPKAGEFGAMFMTKQGKNTSYHLTAPGKLEITKFDATGLTATFAFEADSRDNQHVKVQGSFDFGCAGRKCR